MNKRQLKKQYTRAFSKAYDESLKHKHFEQNISISTFTNPRGLSFMFLTINKSVNFTPWAENEMPEISIDGYCVERKQLKK